MSDFILACLQAVFELLLNILDWILLRHQPASKQTSACWLVVLICVVLLVWFTAANSE